jgi:hypothetical protein
MQHLEGSGTPVLYIGRTVLKGFNLAWTAMYYTRNDKLSCIKCRSAVVGLSKNKWLSYLAVDKATITRTCAPRTGDGIFLQWNCEDIEGRGGPNVGGCGCSLSLLLQCGPHNKKK